MTNQHDTIECAGCIYDDKVRCNLKGKARDNHCRTIIDTRPDGTPTLTKVSRNKKSECDACGASINADESVCPKCGASWCEGCEMLRADINPDTEYCEGCTLDRTISRAEALREMM